MDISQHSLHHGQRARAKGKYSNPTVLIPTSLALSVLPPNSSFPLSFLPHQTARIFRFPVQCQFFSIAHGFAPSSQQATPSIATQAPLKTCKYIEPASSMHQNLYKEQEFPTEDTGLSLYCFQIGSYFNWIPPSTLTLVLKPP